MALTKVTGFGIGTIVDNVVMTSDDPTITMTDSSGTTDIATLVATSGALIVTARDGNADGEIIFKGDTGSAVTEHARIANTGLMTVISEGNAVQTSVQQGLVKAWVHAHQDAAQDSFNVASSADNGTGDYTFTFTNNFTSVSTSAFGSNQSTRNGQGLYIDPAVATVRINPSNASGASADQNTSLAIAGDLA